MKKMSLILLIVAATIVITGIALCTVGYASSTKDQAPLFRQEKDPEGNLIEKVNLSDEILNKININIPNANINVYGNSEKCYVEIVNFKAIEYSVYTNNRALTIENDLLNAAINRVSAGDLGYNGLRDYFRIAKAKEKKEINIYLTNENEIKLFDFTLTNGNVFFDGISTISDYKINLTNGNIEFKNTEEISKISAKVSNGNIDLKSTFSNQAEIEIKNGDLLIDTANSITYNYMLTVEIGDIQIGSEYYKGKYKNDFEDADGKFTANIEIGNIKIKTSE